MYRPIAIIILGIFTPGVLWAQAAVEPAKKYAGAVAALRQLIEREAADKRLPAVSIALVDDQRVVWAQGFGFEDPEAKKPATAETVYRVGSVSKLFTDIAVMQLVEQGKLDLDAPVTKYLPEFKPADPFGKPISLRQMMAHRSGLVREPPVGNYFDPTNPPLAKMVESLNTTTLVYEPGTRQKYSNAAIATVGYTLQQVAGAPYDQVVQEKVLKPLGMASSFTPTPAVTKRLAKAVMWTYHGREFPAPTFELGEAPAGCMYATVNDLARFLTVVFNDVKTEAGPLLKPETLKEMLTPQFPKRKGDPYGFGLGFTVSELGGATRVGHGGAIYGFATDLAFLPEEKLGVVVVASRDVANPVMTRIANAALQHLVAVKHGKPLPKIESWEPIPADKLAKLAGRLAPAGDTKHAGFDLFTSGGRAFLWPAAGGFIVELRQDKNGLVADGLLGAGTPISLDGATFSIPEVGSFTRTDEGPVAATTPAEPPKHFLGLIGEYGWDHNTLYVFEKDGKLHALIEWFFEYPLKQETEDVYAFPDDFGLYPGEKLVFHRDANGKATEVVAASVLFKRRTLDGEDGKTFRIQPVKPVAELRAAAMKASPPREEGEFRKAELVELASLDPTIKLDLRYATDNNFLSTPLYPPSAKGYMQKPAAEALARVHKDLEADGYGLLIHDPYRPWYVTKMFWDATPDKFHNFVADPSKGSRHNRGCAVDLTLYDRKTGKPVEMVSGFDEFSDRSYPDYIGGTSRQRWHRDLLRRRMEAAGFTVYEAEWWHFDYKDWKSYGILNQTFEELAKQ